MSSIDRREALKRVAVLLGGTLSVPTVAGVMSGCQTGRAPADLQALSSHQNDLVVTISDYIIPATDTPGAKAANVNRFIDTMLAESFLPKARKRFLSGLDEVDPRSEKMHGAAFLESTQDQQVALLETLDEEAFGENADFDPSKPPFFRTMKELTLVGYYTSEIGATQELRFDPVMGRYDACVPLEKIGRAWA